MRQHLVPVKTAVRWGMNLIPTLLFERVEDVVQRQLGKGSGAWSTKVEVAAISHFINQKSIKKIVAIDAGANLGDWSYELMRHFPTSEIIAFEPSKEAFARLQERFSEAKSVQCENVALGRVDAITKLYSDRSGSGLGSLTKRRVDHFNIGFDFEEEIEVNTLDSWIANLGYRLVPNILKMDVEGHELDILLGAKESIKHIEIVQFEFGGSNIDTRTYFQDFWYFFKDHNFDLFRITPRKPKLIHKYSEIDECFRATNYLAVKNSSL